MNLAYQAFRMTLTTNNDHAEAHNNLGVLEFRKGHLEQVNTDTDEAISIANKIRERNFENTNVESYQSVESFRCYLM